MRAWQACRSYFPTPLVTTPWKGCLWSCLGPNASSTEHAGLCPFLLSLMSLAKIKSNMVPKRWKTIFKPCPLSPAFRRKSRTLRNRPILALWSQWRKPDLFMEASATQNCQPYDVIWAPALKCLRRRGQKDIDDQGDNGGDSENRAGCGGLVGCRLCVTGVRNSVSGSVQEEPPPLGALARMLPGRVGMVCPVRLLHATVIHPCVLPLTLNGAAFRPGCSSGKVKPGEFSQYQ